MLVCVHARRSVRGAQPGQERLIEMSILKPPKFLTAPPSAPPTTKMLQDCQKHFFTKLRRGQGEKKDLPLSHACLRVHTHWRGCQVN